MPTTPTWSITYPDSSSNLTPLESHFQEIAVDADAALTNLKSNVRGSNTTDTIETLKTSVTAINTRLALNLQTSGSTPTGAPTNSGLEGSMHWDSTNNILYIYDAVAGWKIVWRDTAWTNLTMAGGSPNYVAGSSAPQYRVNGNTVYLRGQIAPTGTTVAGTTYTFGSLPSGLFPATTTVFAVASDSFTTGSPNAILKPARLVITPAGNLNIVSAFGGVDAPNYFINCSYLLG